jgi:hypothetical protein
LGAEGLFRHSALITLSFLLNLFTGQFGLQAIHLKDQLLLDLTQAKEAGLIPREGLTQRSRKIRRKKETRNTKSKGERKKEKAYT